MFSAVFTNQAEFTAYLVVMSALPWTLWRLDVALAEHRLLPAAQAGAIWGLAALSGYPAHTIIGSCWLGAWAAARMCSLAGGAMRKLAALNVFAAVTIIVLAPAYLGFLHELRDIPTAAEKSPAAAPCGKMPWIPRPSLPRPAHTRPSPAPREQSRFGPPTSP